MVASRLGLAPKKLALASKMATAKGWSHDQGLTLLFKVEGHLNDADQKKSVYVKDITWREVMFDDFDEREVQKRWNCLTAKVRKL